ncbi:MAG: FG-GAP repeat domain-containing protein [Planctomycetota bacterium]|jgi:hypothetical protein
MITKAPVIIIAALLTTSTAQAGEWLIYADETSTRMPTGDGLNTPEFTTEDPEDKNYAWGDVDLDGDVDLICVRKQPYIEGRRRNVLYINEGIKEGHAINGVLVDRTAQFATGNNDGGQGMLDLTDDRDVVLLDLNNDGWLDIITATTYGQGLPKTISHPRVYMNLGALDDEWQGFRYDQTRTPTLPIVPNFCGIGHGDVNSDEALDVYFTDYTNSLEDRLWINDGNGFFTDQSESRMTFEMRESEFGVHAEIADMNGDGAPDIVKDRANGSPYRISIAYNDPGNPGFFTQFQTVYSGAPYYVEVADLNNDGLLDIALQDDGIDRYYLNQGNGIDGLANFLGFAMPPQSSGFEGTMEVADLDNDSFIDVLITDETVNLIGTNCTGHMRIWRNDGNTPAITLVEESAGIPVTARTGTSDVAPIDLNGDGWLDLVIGRCAGTSVWMAQVGLEFVYPDGLLQEILDAGASNTLAFQVDGIGPGSPEPGSAEMFISVNDAPFGNVPVQHLGNNQYTAQLPPLNCLDTLRYYVTAVEQNGQAVFTDPHAAPFETYAAIATEDLTTSTEDFEAEPSGWQVINDPSLTSGAWETAIPVGTIFGGGAAAPGAAASGDVAYVTQNCPAPPESCTIFPAGNADVDGGPTQLFSPMLDLAGADAIINFRAWHYSNDDDVLAVFVSNDAGQNWTPVATIANTGGAWLPQSFRVGDFVAPTGQVQVRLDADDGGTASVVESGIDLFQADVLSCGTSGPAVPATSDWGMLLMVLLLAVAATTFFRRSSVATGI